MIQALEFLAAPICLALLLVGIHAYLGLHVLQREVIFVDISLSQVAALGTAVSLFFIWCRDHIFYSSCGSSCCVFNSSSACGFSQWFFNLQKQLKKCLYTAWLVGFIGILTAFSISFWLDLPAGPVMVCVLIGIFFLSLFKRTTKAPQ